MRRCPSISGDEYVLFTSLVLVFLFFSCCRLCVQRGRFFFLFFSFLIILCVKAECVHVVWVWGFYFDRTADSSVIWVPFLWRQCRREER